MPRRPYRTLDDNDIEDLGVFEYLDNDEQRFVPAPPGPPPRPRPPIPPDDPVALRLRSEPLLLWGWILTACLLANPGLWLLEAGGVIALACWLRPSYEQRDMLWVFKLYLAAAGGQAVAALVGLFQWWALAPAVGLYAFGVLLLWIGLEIRHQVRQAHAPPDSVEDWAYYYYS